MDHLYDPPPSTSGAPWSYTYDNDLGGDSTSAFASSGSGSENELRRAQSPVEDVRRLWTEQARNIGPGENANTRLSAPRPSYRRAVSAGALPTLSSATITYPPHEQLPTPAPSLFSPPLTAMSADGRSVEASGSAFAAAQECFLDNQPPLHRAQYPTNTSPGSQPFFLPSPTNFSPSPSSHTAQLHRQLLEREEDHPQRGSRPAHSPFLPNASLSGAHAGAGSRHSPRSLSNVLPSSSASDSYSASTTFSISQQSFTYPSNENDVHQLLSDIHEMLGPETIAALSPPQTRRMIQRSEPPPSPLSHHRTRVPYEPRGRIECSGVLLDPEDLDMMTQPPLIDRPPSPPYREAYGQRPTFEQPPSPFAPHHVHHSSGPSPYQPRPTNHRTHHSLDASSYYFSPPMSEYDRPSLRHALASQPAPPPPPHRPRSAPASPELGGGGFAFTSGSSYYTPADSYAAAPPSSMPHEVRHRRGSSVDGFLMAGPHDGYREPTSIDEYAQVYPTTPTRQSFAPRVPNSAPSLGARRPAKARKGGAGKGVGSMFVNFSASDASALLSGVAPSGSSKRKREEEEERCRREVRSAL